MGNSFLITAEEEQRRQSRDRSKKAFLKKYKTAEPEQKVKIFNHLRRLSLEDAPRTAAELHKYYQVVFGYTIPFTACSEDMDAPFEWICDSYFGRYTQTLTIAPRGGGKANCIKTKIPTPKGFKFMGDLVVGDEVYDSQGNVCKVTFATEIMYGRKCYDVVFDDGTTIIADADHQWYSWTKRVRMNNRDHERRREKQGDKFNHDDWRIKPDYVPEVLTTETMSKSLGYGLMRTGHYHNGTQERNHAVKTCGAVQGVSENLFVDPYVLGLWLGDGTTVHGEITTADLEILDMIEAHGYETVKRKKKYLYSIYKLRTGLRKIGVLGNKHIPANYLRASIDDRLELLRGLMDSDGWFKKGGSMVYSTVKEQFALDVRELVNSLGIKAGFAHRVAKLNKKIVSEDFRISFQTNIPVFKLSRKLDLQAKYNKYRETNKYRYVKTITERESVPVRCIQVDSPDSSYLCSESFVITHNTSIAAADAYTKCKFRPNYSIVHAASNLSQSDVAKEYLSGFSNDKLLRSHLMSDPTKKEARWKSNSKWNIRTGSMAGISGLHPIELKIDEIEFAEWSFLEQSFAVPIDQQGYTKQWSGFSTRQRSYGGMSRLTSQIEAGLKDIKMYKWSCFETMKRCNTCVAIDEHPHGNDESRQQSCALWKYCHGQKGTKSTGWISRKDVIEMSKTLSDEGFETQFLCLRPSSHGLTCHNFIHETISNNDVNVGNYCQWVYDNSLPLFGMHDPAEGNKSVFVFFQIFNGMIFVFDEIILDPCFTTGEMKKEVYKRCVDMGYPLNLLVLVDPHRQDAMKEWQEGEYSGEGNGRSFNAEIPHLLEYEEIDPGLELLRRYIKAAHGERRLFINNKKCPGMILAVKENHYNVDKNNNILQGAKQAKAFKDEIDVLRYLVIYVEKTYVGGSTTGNLS